MTLNLFVVAPWGIWVCSDHRLYDGRNDRLVDDFSIKHVALRCKDGGAILTYAGLGACPGETRSLSEWVRETLRGESRTVDETMVFLRERANRDLAGSAERNGLLHAFTAGAFIGKEAYVLQLHNAQGSPVRPGPLRSEFQYAAMKVERAALVGGLGSGAYGVLKKETDLIRRIASKRRRTPESCSRLLAQVNERVSQDAMAGKYVSKGCITVHMPSSIGPFSMHIAGPRPSERRQHEHTVPLLVFGIDTTEMTRGLMKDAISRKSGEPVLPLDDVAVEAAGKRSVQPRA